MRSHTKKSQRLGLGTASMIGVMALVGCGANGQGAEGEGNGADLTGESVEFITPYGPGGTYDRLLREMQPGFEAETGATAIVENEPGAGTLLATNRTYADTGNESRIQLINTVAAVTSQLAGDEAEGVNFDVADFEWLVGVSAEPNVLIAQPDSPLVDPDYLAEAIQDGEELRYGAMGPGDSSWLDGTILREVLGANISMISGFDGAPEQISGLVRGDVDIMMASLSSVLVPILAGDAEPVLYVGDDMSSFEEANAILSDIPDLETFALDLGISEDDLMNYIEPYTDLLSVSRILALPPEADEDVAEAYREAFTSVIDDPAFIEEKAEDRLYIVPTSREEVDEVLNNAQNAPDEFVDLVGSAFTD